MQSTTESSTETILRTETIAPATDGGGLMKEVLREGDGATPSYGDRVTAHYTGRLLSGDVFDSSVTRGRPFEFNIGKQEVIKGWDQGFATMRVGERAFLTCGPGYAYGDRGAGDKIPANATLRFEVELLATKPTPPKGIPGARLAKAEGTAAFEGGDLVGAIEAWTRGWQEVEYEVVEEGALGVDLRVLKTALRSNAAMAYLKRGEWKLALSAAEDAIGVDPTHVKSHFRAAQARAALGLLDDALSSLSEASRLAPGDAAVRTELDRIKGLKAAALNKEKKLFAGAFAAKKAAPT